MKLEGSKTEANLIAALAGESQASVKYQLYPSFAKTAKEEGFTEIAKKMELIASIEKDHEERYRMLEQNIQDGTVFRKNDKVSWICRNCGYIYEGETAPMVCPVCKHKQSFFEVKKPGC